MPNSPYTSSDTKIPADGKPLADRENDKKVLGDKPIKGPSDDDKQSFSANKQSFSANKQSFSANKKIPPAPVSRPKEQEPAASPDVILEEIQERSKEADEHAEKQVQEAIGKEARLKEPEPNIPPDLEDHWVKSPEKEASEVVSKGGTIDLPISKKEYEEGKETKIKSKVTRKLEVFGVSSVVALTMIVGRIIKLAHHHAKKVVFRKSSSNTSEKKEDD